MAVKKKTVKSKTSAVKKKTAMKKAATRGRPKSVKKAATKTVASKKAAVKKTPVKKAAANKKAPVAKATNSAADRVRALRAEVAELKADLKNAKKREAGLEKMLGKITAGIEKTVSATVKKEMSALDKSLQSKPRKKRAAKATAPAAETPSES